ncbi:hypothetical protein HPB48_000801 [Haemaphysalis longicornis]|uniref:Uncharacterized protein n=1 Tax=Haemaphysalis longicornis TaxID=44386 RepID=A0A9J6GIV7_HAELO|nr:hypothetical protein HPB48_000801 [Haemaphysalis longicornis]
MKVLIARHFGATCFGRSYKMSSPPDFRREDLGQVFQVDECIMRRKKKANRGPRSGWRQRLSRRGGRRTLGLRARLGGDYGASSIQSGFSEWGYPWREYRRECPAGYYRTER